MRRFVLNIEGIGCIELVGETAEDAIMRAGYDLEKTVWTLITVKDVEDVGS